MKVLVIGCGRLGSQLAYRMFQRGVDVVVVDSNPQSFYNLPLDFNGLTVEGDALSREVLHRAGIEQADGLVAATDTDALNAVVGYVASSVYGVQRVAVRNYNPSSRTMLEAFGLQVVSSASWGAQRLEELIYHGDVHTVYSAGNGEVEIYEFTIPAEWDGHKVKELLLDGQNRIVSVTRAGRAFLPGAEAALETGDIILVSATLEGIEQIRDRLCMVEE